jgi:hypothetical protein
MERLFLDLQGQVSYSPTGKKLLMYYFSGPFGQVKLPLDDAIEEDSKEGSDGPFLSARHPWKKSLPLICPSFLIIPDAQDMTS